MTKRSAMTMAAGLAFALLAGVVAISLTLGGTPAANAIRERKPLVKHQVQTVTVHRRAGSASPSGVQVIQLPSTSTSTSSMESSSRVSFDDGSFDDTSSDGAKAQGSFGDD